MTLTPVTRAPQANSTPAAWQAASRNRSVSTWRRLVKGGGNEGGGNVLAYTSRPRYRVRLVCQVRPYDVMSGGESRTHPFEQLQGLPVDEQGAAARPFAPLRVRFQRG